MKERKLGTYMVGISRTPGQFYALFKCTGLVNAVNATTLLSRCFPGNPGIAKYRKPLYPEEEATYLPDDSKLGFTQDELKEVLAATYTIAKDYQ